MARPNAWANCSASGATRIPLPPPPAAALMITGNPSFWATLTPSSIDSTGPGEPGTVGTLSFCASLRAAALSPIWPICSAVGPMKVMFDARTVFANSAFSARNP